MGSDANFDLKTANGSALPYIGYVVLLFSFKEGEPGIKVPMLVTNSILDLPIIGYNVLEEIITSPCNDFRHLLASLQFSLNKDREEDNIMVYASVNFPGLNHTCPTGNSFVG